MQEENSQKVKIFSRRLRALRSQAGLTQTDLAAKLGLSLGTVGNWEAERNIPQISLLNKLGEFFKVPVSFLLGEGKDDLFRAGAEAGDREPMTLREGSSFYQGKHPLAAAANYTRDPEAFWLEWFGDSMEPKLISGDLLLISPNAAVDDGDLVMAKKENGEITVRIFTGRVGGDFSLVAYNSTYPARECRSGDFKFVYAVCFSLRTLKLRGLYEPAKEGEK